MALIRVGHRRTDGLPRLLVLRALGLGDLLTAVPALRALARAHPRHERVLALPRRLAPLVRLLDGAVDAITDVDFRRVVGRLPLDGAAPDVAVNLHGRGPESHHALLALRPASLVAFAHRRAWPHGPRWRDDEHERHRWCRLLRAAGLQADPDDLALPAPRDGAAGRFRGATIVHPGASAPARVWPADRWAAVVRDERRRGAQVVITGGPDEVELARAIAVQAGVADHRVLAGRTDVLQLAALVAVAGRVVCGDTGVAHLASAFATPSVVLFGPVAPSRWGPPCTPAHVALWAGDVGDPHGDRPHPGLLAISVEHVRDALHALPRRR